jgi:hypothetical protein
VQNRHARRATIHGVQIVTDDWQKLGDVVARITERMKVTSGPPVATDDAAVFLLMLREVYAPPAPERGAGPCEQEPRHKGQQ